MSDQPFFSDTNVSKGNLTEYSVTEISASLKKTVEERFGYVRVRGEITGYRGPHSSGHSYFALKDDRARIEAVIWRGAASRLKHRPEEGMEVIASGKLTTYPGSSKYQIVIDALEPAGTGALMALLEERKKKLEIEGLFAPERKQLLPYLPRKIGVITSPTGAVIRDVLHRISDRFPLHVIVWPVRVQGETTGAEVSQAVTGFNELTADEKPDLLIVARGGGSIEDLWGFNEEAVVRAVADSDIPVISAVGHETDWTLVDFAADVRAPTPTGAAEIAVPVKADLEATIASDAARLKSSISNLFDRARSSLRAATRGLATPDMLLSMPRRRLDEASGRVKRGLELAVRKKATNYERVASRLSHRGLLMALGRNSERLDNTVLRMRNAHTRNKVSAQTQERDLSQRHNHAFSISFERMAKRFSQADRLLNNLSYERVLDRGYALVRNNEGKPIASVTELNNGDALNVQFNDGAVNAVVGKKKPGSKPIAKPIEPRSDPGKQGDLF
ncbi:MAG: exodeoxyribonuclease VII large subunit [Pseudomonadota bacterium]